MRKILDLIVDFFQRLFRCTPIVYIDLLDEYEDYICGNDISQKDTLIGTVRSIEQYRLNYEHCFYHIPASYVEDPDKIKYIALYRSKNIFRKDDPGIKHIGSVISYEYIKRADIKELPLSFNYNDMYYKFNVNDWRCLEPQLEAREVGLNVCRSVNMHLLRNVRFFNELQVNNNNEFKLQMGLIDITHGVYDGFFVGEYKVRVCRRKIILVGPKVKIKFSVDEYKRHPYSTIKNISKIVF